VAGRSSGVHVVVAVKKVSFIEGGIAGAEGGKTNANGKLT